MAPLTGMIANGARRAAYGAAQSARVLWFTGHYIAGRRAARPLTPPGEAPYAEEFAPLDRQRLKQAFREAFDADWRNIERGEYRMPREIRRPPNPAALLRLSRDYLADAARVARRKFSGGHSEVLTEARRAAYPRYYLQNFHYQSDGWLSRESADRYDMQVETLFTGAAGAMRRQALPFVRSALGGRDPAGVALLDLGCGAGAFLAEALDNWPSLDATGLDLSPAYLDKARETLAGTSAAFVAAPAEKTGFGDETFDIVTAVYLFHELPPGVRLETAREIARLLKPGGVFILVDTIQYGDELGLDILLENFPRAVHEPYYDSFCRTDLAALGAQAGLEKREETVAFLTKVTVFRKRNAMLHG